MLEAGPIFLATWCLLNLSPLIRAPVQRDYPLAATTTVQPETVSETSEASSDAIGQRDAAGKTPVAPVVDEVAKALVPTGWLDRLPPAIGRDIISISADLHYLNVVTAGGRALVLGNLRDTAAELEAFGIQVHRSHWVAVPHVRRVVRTASGWNCVLSDARVLRISRRRVEAVKTRLGTGFLIEN